MESNRYVTAITAVCWLALSSSGVDAQEVNWKMHVALPDSRAETKVASEFAQNASSEIEKFSITLFSSGSLGIRDADLLRILPRGNVIQAAALYPGYLTRDNPDFAYILPPGVASEASSLVKALPVLREIYGKVYADAGVKALGFIGHATRDTHIMCKEPVRSLEDLRKLKVRVWEQFHVDVFEELGISAQIIGQGDLYVAMQTGVVDCAVYPIGLAVTVSLQEVAPYAAELFPYVMHPWTIVVSQNAFDALSPEAQAVLERTGSELEKDALENYVNGVNDGPAAELFVDTGGTVLEPFTDADRLEFREAAHKIWRDQAESGSEQRKENYEKVNKVIR